MGRYLWNILEKSMRYVICRICKIQIREETWNRLMQFVKFALVGFSNVIVSYVVYLCFFFLFQKIGLFQNTDYLIAQLLGYVLSIFWSFYWNRKYVFKLEEETPWLPALLKSFLSYSFTGVFLNSVLSYVWVEVVGIPKIIAPVINLVINVPVNFLMNKFWAFRRKKIK